MFGFAPVWPLMPVGLSAGDSWGRLGAEGGLWHAAMNALPKSSSPSFQSLPETSTLGDIHSNLVAPAPKSALCSPRGRRSVGMQSALPETNP